MKCNICHEHIKKTHYRCNNCGSINNRSYFLVKRMPHIILVLVLSILVVSLYGQGSLAFVQDQVKSLISQLLEGPLQSGSGSQQNTISEDTSSDDNGSPDDSHPENESKTSVNDSAEDTSSSLVSPQKESGLNHLVLHYVDQSTGHTGYKLECFNSSGDSINLYQDNGLILVNALKEDSYTLMVASYNKEACYSSAIIEFDIQDGNIQSNNHETDKLTIHMYQASPVTRLDIKTSQLKLETFTSIQFYRLGSDFAYLGNVLCKDNMIYLAPQSLEDGQYGLIVNVSETADMASSDIIEFSVKNSRIEHLPEEIGAYNIQSIVMACYTDDKGQKILVHDPLNFELLKNNQIMHSWTGFNEIKLGGLEPGDYKIKITSNKFHPAEQTLHVSESRQDLMVELEKK